GIHLLGGDLERVLAPGEHRHGVALVGELPDGGPAHTGRGPRHHHHSLVRHRPSPSDIAPRRFVSARCPSPASRGPGGARRPWGRASRRIASLPSGRGPRSTPRGGSSGSPRTAPPTATARSAPRPRCCT